MPYRRLPNTDQARIRSMQTAIEQCGRTNVPDLAFSIKTKNEAEAFLPAFESAHHEYLMCLEKQVSAGKSTSPKLKWPASTSPTSFKC